MSIILGDPDTFVQWNRTDEPGDNPKWESQCGLIEQIGFGDSSMFQGYVGPEKVLITPKTILSVVKKEVERLYQKQRSLAWAYES